MQREFKPRFWHKLLWISNILNFQFLTWLRRSSVLSFVNYLTLWHLIILLQFLSLRLI